MSNSITDQINSLVTAIQADSPKVVADRRANNIGELVALVESRARAAEWLDVHVSAIDQSLKRVRDLNRRGLQIDWEVGEGLYFGTFIADEEDEEEDLISKALAAADVRRPSPTCTHEYPAGQNIVVQPRGRRTGVNNDSHIVYEAVTDHVCLAC